jgi:uncharacterized protein YutE (UPF0331/DUF86 family)
MNTEKLKARAADVRSAVAKIAKYTALPDDVFWSDERNLFSVKYLLLQSMEALGSICVHVLAKEFNFPASSYASCFEEMEKRGVLTKELSAKLRKIIRFRNLLVHRYWEVDEKRVVQYAREDTGDMLEMLKIVWDHLGLSDR